MSKKTRKSQRGGSQSQLAHQHPKALQIAKSQRTKLQSTTAKGIAQMEEDLRSQQAGKKHIKKKKVRPV